MNPSALAASAIRLSIAALAVAIASRSPAEEPAPSADAIRSAAVRSIPLLELGAKGSLEHRKNCFTCHNQGLPVMALTAARSRRLAIDADNLQTQVRFVSDFLTKNKANYLEGKGQGGQVDTAGYALWTLDVGGHAPDETTAAVAEYFLKYQSDADHYRPSSQRPPSEQSLLTSSYLALRALKRFGTEAQQPRIAARVEQVGKWLRDVAPADTEDRVFRLRGLQLIGAEESIVRAAADDLKQLQRPDGGWSQTAELASDAYATGSVLVSLHEAGGLATSDACYLRGLAWLISNQQQDGSWHVVSRSDPFQIYFESGYPHGKDQFISIAAAAWATKALVLALPMESERPAGNPSQPAVEPVSAAPAVDTKDFRP